MSDVSTFVQEKVSTIRAQWLSIGPHVTYDECTGETMLAYLRP